MGIPKIPLGVVGAAGIQWATAHLAFLIQSFGNSVTALDQGVVYLLRLPPPPLLIILICALTWRAGERGTATFAALALSLIWNQGLWPATATTLGLVFTATVLSLCIAIPAGIAIDENKILRIAITPMLDFLQTMPRFVYLIPAVIILGIDVAPAVFATMTLAVVPPIRLTATGLAEVDPAMIEAGKAMGCSRRQILTKIKLPLALPALMLAVNQCIMMALSMVVIAALVGTSGLGEEILKDIAVLNAGKGLMAGFAVFTLAVILNRATSGLGQPRQSHRLRSP
jgi:ABC-type proline/glycine betaine transport system permease subunit